MIKIGITGSLGSGKTTASKLIAKGRGPIFSADSEVKKLYKEKKFQYLISKKFNIKKNFNLKKELKKKILSKSIYIKRLEKIIHPIVRKKMFKFFNKNKHRKFLFCEIPLLIESTLMKYFDKTIFIKSSKKIRLKRYILSGGDKKLFFLLDKKQFKDTKKMAMCDYVVVNNTSLIILKKKLSNIIITNE